MDLDIFRKYIIRRVAGEVVYSETTRQFRLDIRPVTATMRREILAEGKQWGLSEAQASDYLNGLLHQIDHEYKARETTMQSMDLTQVPVLGETICLTGRDQNGEERLTLLFLGQDNPSHACRLMVLSSSRLALRPDDILEPYDNTCLTTDAPATFVVYRDGRRFPDAQRVYVTYKLQSITRLSPSTVHEVIDSQKKFTYVEHQAETTSGETQLTLGRNAMTLLLHDFSHCMAAYADFADDGTGTFRSNPSCASKPGAGRDHVFGIPENYRKQTVSIETVTPGEVYMDDTKGRLLLRKPAETVSKPC